MAKLFSVASWNVEHFKDDPARIARVVGFVRKQKPDVFALYEVEGRTVFSELVKQFPGYQFHITEGNQVQEILVAVRSSLTAFFTQRLEFKTGNTYLRPGALLTLTVAGQNYTLLFLHTKSGTDPIGLGIRDEMLERALDFKKTLDKASANGAANYMFMGDLNTMGMKYPFDRSIDPTVELQKLDAGARKRRMRRLAKSAEMTWWNGPKSRMAPSNLDHVVVADQLKLKSFAAGVEIDVRGWASFTTDPERQQWIADYSDHSLLFFQLEK